MIFIFRDGDHDGQCLGFIVTLLYTLNHFLYTDNICVEIVAKIVISKTFMIGEVYFVFRLFLFYKLKFFVNLKKFEFKNFCFQKNYELLYDFFYKNLDTFKTWKHGDEPKIKTRKKSLNHETKNKIFKNKRSKSCVNLISPSNFSEIVQSTGSNQTDSSIDKDETSNKILTNNNYKIAVSSIPTLNEISVTPNSSNIVKVTKTQSQNQISDAKKKTKIKRLLSKKKIDKIQ